MNAAYGYDLLQNISIICTGNLLSKLCRPASAGFVAHTKFLSDAGAGQWRSTETA